MPIIEKQIPRGTTSFYDFSNNEEAQQPVAAAPQENGANGTPAAPAAPVTTATPVAPVANGAPVNTTPEQQYQSDVDKMVQWQQNTEAQRRADEQAQNPVATKNGNSSSASSSNASSTSTKTTTTTVSPYEPFKGDNLGDLVDYIEKERDRVKPETDEEREKREKREKRLDFLSRLRDGLSTFHTAYSYARGVKPMDLTMMSPRARELFEKAKRERDKDADRRLNLTLVLQNLKDKERAWKYNVTKDETARADRQAAAAAQAEQAAAALKERARQHDDMMDLEKGKAAQAAAELQEKVRGNKAKEAIEWAKVKVQRAAQQHAQQKNPDYTDFTLGDEYGTIRVPKSGVNSHNFAVVYNSLPNEYKAAYGTPMTTYSYGKRVPVLDENGNQKYSLPSADQMSIAVAAFLGDEKADALQKNKTRNALKQIGTQVGGKPIKTQPKSQPQKKGSYSSFSIHK
jgi:hypothetical protein